MNYKKMLVTFELPDNVIEDDLYNDGSMFDMIQDFVMDIMGNQSTFLDKWGSEIDEGSEEYADILDHVERSINIWHDEIISIDIDLPSNMVSVFSDDSTMLDEFSEFLVTTTSDLGWGLTKTDEDKLAESVTVSTLVGGV